MKIYHYYKDTKEFYETEEYKVVPGFGLPAFSTKHKPIEPKEHFAVVFNEAEDKWEYTEDHRGEVVFSIATKEAQTVGTLGSIHPDFTPISPFTPFDKFIDDKWVTPDVKKATVDTVELPKETQHEIEDRLILEAQIIQDLIHRGQATKREAKHLAKINEYFADLTRLYVTHVELDPPTYPVSKWYDRKHKEKHIHHH